MSTQHTQGPWSVTDGHYPSFKEISGPSFKISVVMWATDLTEDDYRKRDADLHLIAAAPDLLKALNAMLTHMGMDEDEWNKPTFDQARAAIAKATGAA
jgi:hypothetical protein